MGLLGDRVGRHNDSGGANERRGWQVCVIHEGDVWGVGVTCCQVELDI